MLRNFVRRKPSTILLDPIRTAKSKKAGKIKGILLMGKSLKFNETIKKNIDETIKVFRSNVVSAFTKYSLILRRFSRYSSPFFLD